MFEGHVFSDTAELLEHTVLTIEITLVGALVAFAASMLSGLARLSRFVIVRAIARVYVEVFRGVAALVILFWIYYALPHFGISLDAFTVAVVGIGLNVGAYGSEVVRSAILSVDKGQWEAAQALNYTRGQTMRKIILPQAFVMMVPPLGNLWIELMKVTALVSLIAISELTSRTVQLNNAYFRTMELFSINLVIYFCIALVITGLMRLLEWRLARMLGREGRLA